MPCDLRLYGLGVVELGRIELPSVRRTPGLLRPFPSLRLAAAATPGRVDPRIRPPDLSPVPAVFAGCQRVSPCRPPLLLVPGCSGLAPRAIAGRDDSRR